MDRLLRGGRSAFSLEGVSALANFPIAIATARKGFGEGNPKKLFDLLVDHYQFMATDKRDNVYALSGIAIDAVLEL
jgi:hypothetical protein